MDWRRELRDDYEPGRTNILTAQLIQKFLHTYSVGVNTMLKGMFERTISPDTGGDNKTGMGYNNRDVRVVKWEVQ